MGWKETLKKGLKRVTAEGIRIGVNQIGVPIAEEYAEKLAKKVEGKNETHTDKASGRSSGGDGAALGKS